MVHKVAKLSKRTLILWKIFQIQDVFCYFWHWIAYKSEFSRVQRDKPLVDWKRISKMSSFKNRNQALCVHQVYTG